METICTMDIGGFLFLSSGVSAQINSLAFKGVTQYFKEGKEFYSPVMGATALEAGLMYNLRFYGHVTRGQGENGTFIPINDKGMDALTTLVKLFFPSPAGQLSVETTAANNFGKFVDTPETVALLLNFSKLCRDKLAQESDLKKEKENGPQVQAMKRISEEMNRLKALKKENDVRLKDLSTSLTKNTDLNIKEGKERGFHEG